MPLNEAFIGKVFAPTAPYQVSREKIREFGLATAATPGQNGQPVVLSTFPIVLSLPATRHVLSDPALGLDYSRVVHGRQRFRHTRDIRAGDELTVTVHIEQIQSGGVHQIVTTRSEIATTAGEPVSTAFSTLVERGTRPRPGLRDAEPARPWTAPGQQLPDREFKVTRQDLVRYAGASGDFNPIHFSDHAAGQAGLPGVIGHGMLTMALTARAVTEWIGDLAGVLDHETQFKRPLLVPDDGGTTLTVSATVGDPDDAGHRQLVAEANAGADLVAISRLTIL
ncbi:hypothetical protein GCM10009827_109180 [Dactylosporangium maewongense]|uniref:Acyl dehydratase n=1 Tax=Dactylosporangium maewongense TaxID=634393 RepID=A0ABP4NZ23_9ACTN